MDALLGAIAAGIRIFDLGQPLEASIPVSPNHPPFRSALMRRHGDFVRADGSSAANDLFASGTHPGTHVDALSHMSLDDQLYGGASASAAQSGGRFRSHGIETMAPLVCRGVLLDIPRLQGVDCLDPGYAITGSDLEAAAAAQGVEVHEGDVVLVRSGWPKHWRDPVFFLGQEHGVPGPDLSAAHWLSAREYVCTGAETVAYEQIVAGRGRSLLGARPPARREGHQHRRDARPGRVRRRRRLRIHLRARAAEDRRRDRIAGAAARRSLRMSGVAARAGDPTPLQQLAAFAAETRSRGLPPELVHDVKRRILDVVGNSLGAHGYEPARISLAVATAWGGAERASAIGSGARFPAAAAALVNGTLAHTLDFDDTHLPSVLHPSASVIPAALAVAEAEGRSGMEAIVAIAVGNEINVRLGSAGFDAESNVNLFFEHGLHATSVCGARTTR